MTEEQYKLLGVFETRVRQLMFLCDNLEEKNNQLKIQLAGLNESSNALLEENKLLKNKYDNLKMAKIISVRQDDFRFAQNKLSKLVRGVDKCIALLNE
jgi:FtsZ-binding cell division protein ZapB